MACVRSAVRKNDRAKNKITDLLKAEGFIGPLPGERYLSFSFLPFFSGLPCFPLKLHADSEIIASANAEILEGVHMAMGGSHLSAAAKRAPNCPQSFCTNEIQIVSPNLGLYA